MVKTDCLPCEPPQPRSAPSFSFVCPSFPLRWCLRLACCVSTKQPQYDGDLAA